MSDSWIDHGDGDMPNADLIIQNLCPLEPTVQGF